MILIHDAIDIANSIINNHNIKCRYCNLNYNIYDAITLYHKFIYDKYRITYKCQNYKCKRIYTIDISHDGKIIKQYNSYEKLCIIL